MSAMGSDDIGKQWPVKFGRLLCAFLAILLAASALAAHLERRRFWSWWRIATVTFMLFVHVLGAAVGCARPGRRPLYLAFLAVSLVVDGACFAGMDRNVEEAWLGSASSQEAASTPPGTSLSPATTTTRSASGASATGGRPSGGSRQEFVGTSPAPSSEALAGIGDTASRNQASADWRKFAVVGGHFNYQDLSWLLSYQIILMVPAKYSLLAAPASLSVYLGMRHSAGLAILPSAVIAMLVPVILSVGVRYLLEQMQRRVEQLLEELEGRALDEQRLRIEAEMAAREMARKTGLPLPEDDESETSRSTFNLSVSTEQTEAGPPSWSEEPLEGGLEERQAGRAPRRALCADVGVQTSADVPRWSDRSVKDTSVETSIVWTAQGFRCTCCSKPPRPPAAEEEALRWKRRGPAPGRRRGGQRPSVTSSGSSSDSQGSGRSGSSRGESQRKRPSPLRLQCLQATPMKYKARMLSHCLTLWNIKLRPGTCCMFHALVKEAMVVAVCLQEKECLPEPFESSSSVRQCLKCGACEEVPPEGEVEICQWCESNMLSVPQLITSQHRAGVATSMAL